MPASRRKGRALTITGALLLSSALAAPAFAEIEEVTVTAQKRAEDVQTVPISIAVFTGQDLQARQIDRFRDLIFNTPNVSYTKDQFTGSDFQIRGIGYTATGYDAENGVAVHLDDVYLYAPPLAEAAFYDLDRIEVLRGPQSTLYGGAIGGTVNIVTARPELDQFHADLEGSIGNYDSHEVQGMVNLPVLDGQLGVRLAGDWFQRGGFITNEFDGRDLDGRNTLSFRASVRWEPTTSTTIDFVGAVEHEGDNRMRAQKQYCSTDPSGILGCLPDSISNGLTNPNATLPSVASSVQGLNAAYAGTPLAGLGSALGLFDLTQPAELPALCLEPGTPCNPSDPRKVFTGFSPQYKANDLFYALNWRQKLSNWLDATLVGGWDQNNVWSQESYTNFASVPFDQNRLGNWDAFTGAEGALHAVLLNAGGTAYANLFAPFFTTVPGSLPLSGTKNLGITGGNILKYVPNVTEYDQSDGQSQQQSLELRFNSDFDGPLNFLLAGYYLRAVTRGDYFVNAPTEDYPGIVLGSLNGLNAPQLCFATGCILAPSFYHNVGDEDTLVSKAVFGEVYYDLIPNKLKLTGGLRWTDDEKLQRGRIELFSGLVPLGTTNEKEAMQALVEQGQSDFDQSDPELSVWQTNSVTFNKLTGRAVIDWTPKTNFTDATLVYASYVRGYKAGGFNQGVQPGLGVPKSYLPESVDAFELGTKNTLLGDTLQANLDVWYYNYKDLQVSAIENNTSVNQNIDAELWGVEGEFLWVPATNWQFNLSFGTAHSEIGNSELVDERNPTAGRSDVVLIKDATLGNNVGQNCVIYLIGGQTVTPADNAAFQAYIDRNVPSLAGVFFDPPGGSSVLAAHGVAHANFGTCAAIPETLLQPFGYSRIDPTGHGSASGAFVNLRGNQLQNTPDFTISVGAQYTFALGDGYTLVPRADYYWQTGMFGRIFNDPADRIEAWGVGNAQLTLNAPETVWYVTAWVKNIFNKDNITGEYLAGAPSGLYTNALLGDPRTYGLTAGVHF